MASGEEKNPQPQSEIRVAADFILKGRIGGVPTETVYGLAANALDEKAVRKIFEAKMRPFIDPLIVHVCNMDMARDIAIFSEEDEKLAKAFWPGPLTLVLKKNEKIPDIVTAGLDTVAVRMPSHPVMLSLIEAAQAPIAAPSANPFAYVSPTRAEHVREQLGEKIDFILDGGPCECGLESTIVFTENSSGKILRHGPVSAEDIEKVLGFALDKNPKQNAARPQAPGNMDSHYSPLSPLFAFENLDEINGEEKPVIFFKKPEGVLKSNWYWLSEDGNPVEAAKNLYHMLRTLDKKHTEGFFCQLAPSSAHNACAINDRIIRAAKPRAI